MLNFLFKVRASIINSIKTCHPATYHIALFTNAFEIQGTIITAAAVDILVNKSETRGYQKKVRFVSFYFTYCTVYKWNKIRLPLMAPRLLHAVFRHRFGISTRDPPTCLYFRNLVCTNDRRMAFTVAKP